MWENLSKYKIILASQSPRRVELLGSLDIDFEQKVLNDIDESYPSSLPADEVPEYIVRKKAAAYKSIMSRDALLIAADTLVLLEGQVLGKPQSEDEAKEMLRALSGKKHKVITAMAVLTAEKECYFSDTTTVYFDTLEEADIDYYVKKYQPLDKAGAYGIQDWVGLRGIERIEGSYFNVMGLPVAKLSKMLSKF